MAEQGKHLRVLSLDGGGAKGFYTIGLLSELEKAVGAPLCGSFDLIFGTSTGSIIAALLARGESCETIRALYEKYVPEIMKRRTAGQKSGALRNLAKQVFGEAKFDVFKTRIGIVATNWDQERPLIFKNRLDQAHGSTGSFEAGHGCTIADAIVASCSAYPFFDRVKIKTGKGDTIEAADGGFCANNPTLYAIADALRIVGGDQKRIRVVSLGVGSYPEPTKLTKIRRTFAMWTAYHLITSKEFLQKILGTNTCSMEELKRALFPDVEEVRISDAFTDPAMATDLLEHDLGKLNKLVQKGRISFGRNEARLMEILKP